MENKYQMKIVREQADPVRGMVVELPETDHKKLENIAAQHSEPGARLSKKRLAELILTQALNDPKFVLKLPAK